MRKGTSAGGRRGFRMTVAHQDISTDFLRVCSGVRTPSDSFSKDLHSEGSGSPCFQLLALFFGYIEEARSDVVLIHRIENAWNRKALLISSAHETQTLMLSRMLL